LLTIWVTPENRFAKLATSRPYCSKTGFSGVPNGSVHYSGGNTPYLLRHVMISLQVNLDRMGPFGRLPLLTYNAPVLEHRAPE